MGGRAQKNGLPCMKLSRSGDYKLPGPLACWFGNCLVSMASYVPSALRIRYLLRGSYYQVFEGEQLGDRQGLSINKWQAMQMPGSLAGKSVLDIGCADGFFSRLCSQQGARSVLGVDTAVGRLLRARFMALDERLNIDYRVDTFPSRRISCQFDFVLCLSVLHHSLISKDLWKVLTSAECADDLSLLRTHMKALKSVTAPEGTCIIEMPYEYDDPGERQEVDFDLFKRELLACGFRDARCLGTWEHNVTLKYNKDRLIYVAKA
jgi:SAM-dependent methyltransferase